MKLTRRNRVQLTAALVAAAFAAAGCGSSSNSASSSSKSSPTPTQAARISTVDACKLVTADEASAAVGTTVQNMAGAGGAQIGGLCIYGSADGQASVFVFGEVFADSTTAQSTSPDQIVAAMNSAYGVANAKVVNGIGDKAIEYTTTGMGSNSGMAIFVFKSNVLLMIAMAPSTDSAKIETMARAAVGRL